MLPALATPVALLEEAPAAAAAAAVAALTTSAFAGEGEVGEVEEEEEEGECEQEEEGDEAGERWGVLLAAFATKEVAPPEPADIEPAEGDRLSVATAELPARARDDCLRSIIFICARASTCALWS